MKTTLISFTLDDSDWLAEGLHVTSTAEPSCHITYNSR